MHSIDRRYDGKYIIMSVGVRVFTVSTPNLVVFLGIIFDERVSQSVPFSFSYHCGTGGIAERGKVQWGKSSGDFLGQKTARRTYRQSDERIRTDKNGSERLRTDQNG